MKKFIAIVAIVAVSAVAFCGTTETKITLEQRLEQAIQKGNAQDAALWAAAINSIAQSRHHDEARIVAENYNKLMKTYSNIFKSIPAILDGVSKVAEFNKDSETAKLCEFGKSLLVVAERPLSDKEIKPITDYVIEQDKKIQKEIRKAQEASNKKWGF